MIIKQKQNDKIKEWTVYGYNKQRTYIPKEDAISPNVSTESVILTSIFYANKNRDVSVIDIPNAFIQTHVEEKNHGNHQAKSSLGGYSMQNFFVIQVLCNQG